MLKGCLYYYYYLDVTKLDFLDHVSMSGEKTKQKKKNSKMEGDQSCYGGALLL